MNDFDTYVSIDKLLKATFCATVVDINVLHRRQDNDIGGYLYALQLAHLLDTTLKAQQMNDNNESTEKLKSAAVEESEESTTDAVEESTIDQFKRSLTNMTPMASAQAPYIDRYNLNEPTTRTT